MQRGRAIDYFTHDTHSGDSSSSDDDIEDQYKAAMMKDGKDRDSREEGEGQGGKRKRRKSDKKEKKGKKRRREEERGLEGLQVTVDKRGDADNVALGGLYYKDIPSYNVLSRGGIHQLIGSEVIPKARLDALHLYLKGRRRHDQHASHRDSSSDGAYSGRGRYFDPRLGKRGEGRLLKLAFSKRRMDRIEEEKKEPERNKKALSFIPLPVNVDASDEDPASDADGEGGAVMVESREGYIVRRNKEWNHLITQDPKNVANWFHLIQFQDELSSSSSFISLGVVEKKMEIFKRALRECPDNEELILGMLLSAKDLLDESDLMHLWQNTYAAHEGSILLIKAYIQFRSSHFNSFSREGMREVFVSALNKITAVLSKAASSDNYELKLQAEEAMLQVLFSAADWEVLMGTNERGVAIYQALIEFNVNVPATVKGLPRSTKLKYFEAYWDSEAPRIGDEQSSGWSRWLEAMLANMKTNSAPTSNFFSSSTQGSSVKSREALDKAYELASSVLPPISSVDMKEPSREGRADHISKSIASSSTRDVPLPPPPPSVIITPVSDKEAIYREELADASYSAEDTALLIGVPYDVIGDSNADGYYYSVRHGRRIKNPDHGTSDLLYQKLKGDVETARSARVTERALKDKPKGHSASADPRLAEFMAREIAASTSQWVPVRSTVDRGTAALHPERVSFYEHVEPYLVRLPQRHWDTMLHQFLDFLGVHLPPTTSTNSTKFRDKLSMDDSSTSALSSLLSSNSNYTRALPVGKGNSYAAVDPVVLCNPSKVQFIRNVFFTLRDIVPKQVKFQAALISFENSVSLEMLNNSVNNRGSGPVARDRVGAEYSAEALEAAASKVRSVARSLLQSSQESAADLRLWDSYAALELSHDQHSAAVKVYTKALGLRAALPPLAQRHSCRLYLSYAEYLLWGQVRDEEAKGLLVSIIDKGTGPLSPIRIATLRQQFVSMMNKAASNEGTTDPLLATVGGENECADVPPLCYFAACAALFDYIVIGLDEALGAFHRARGIIVAVMSRTEGDSHTASSTVIPAVDVATADVPLWMRGNGPTTALDPTLTVGLAAGRGRSATLPAWMTRKSEVSSVPPPAHAHAPAPGVHSSTARDERSKERDIRVQHTLSLGLEWLFTKELALIECHRVKNGGFVNPKVVKQSIEKAIQAFPANPLFLAALSEQVRSGAVSDHYNIARLFDTMLKPQSRVSNTLNNLRPEGSEFSTNGSNTSASLWLFAVRAEVEYITRLRKVSTSIPSHHKIRNLFQRAIARGADSMPLLWRLYIAFEVSVGDVEAAKRIFYTAVRSCPSSKSLWSDVRLLSKAFATEDMMNVVNLAGRKGIYWRLEHELTEVDRDMGGGRV